MKLLLGLTVSESICSQAKSCTHWNKSSAKTCQFVSLNSKRSLTGTQLMVCIWRHGGHIGGTTQRNILLVPLSDPAGVGGWHCVPHPERLIANQEYSNTYSIIGWSQAIFSEFWVKLLNAKDFKQKDIFGEFPLKVLSIFLLLKVLKFTILHNLWGFNCDESVVVAIHKKILHDLTNLNRHLFKKTRLNVSFRMFGRS